MDTALFNAFSSSGRYNGSKSCSVILDLEVEQFGAYDTTTPARRDEVTIRLAEIPNPKRGDTLTVGGVVYVLDGSISNDGRIARWHVNAD